MQQIIEKLNKEKIEASWDALNPHLERDAVIIVAKELCLAEAGAHIAIDDKETIASWIQNATLRKPGKEEIEVWNKNPLTMFWMVIVQPFVLIQEITEA